MSDVSPILVPRGNGTRPSGGAGRFQQLSPFPRFNASEAASDVVFRQGRFPKDGFGKRWGNAWEGRTARNLVAPASGERMGDRFLWRRASGYLSNGLGRMTGPQPYDRPVMNSPSRSQTLNHAQDARWTVAPPRRQLLANAAFAASRVGS
jgi:hypothetical protein